MNTHTTTTNTNTSVFRVHSPGVVYNDAAATIEAKYTYDTTRVEPNANGSGGYDVYPQQDKYILKTSTVIPRLGMMLVGWGGNNGSTCMCVCVCISVSLPPPVSPSLSLSLPLSPPTTNPSTNSPPT